MNLRRSRAFTSTPRRGGSFSPRGWLYNVSGFDGVEFTLAHGTRLRFGTDNSRNLITAVEQAVRARKQHA